MGTMPPEIAYYLILEWTNVSAFGTRREPRVNHPREGNIDLIQVTVRDRYIRYFTQEFRKIK